jgi:hypothetical protein
MVPETVAMLFLLLISLGAWVIAVVNVKQVMPRDVRDTSLKFSVFCNFQGNGNCTLHQSKVEDNFSLPRGTNSPWTRPTSQDPCDMRDR